MAHISVSSDSHSLRYLSTYHGLGGAVNAYGHCFLWQSSLPSLPAAALGAPWGAYRLSVSLPVPSWWELSRIWSLTMPLGWTTFCSTFSGLSADLWDQCQPFLLSHSLNTAFPKTQLFLMLWVNSLAPQG